jgi:hypothetical protein
MHFAARNLCNAHAVSDTWQENQRVAFGEATVRFSDPQEVTKFRGGSTVACLGFHAFLSLNTLVFQLFYERKSAGRSFPV